MKNKFLEISGEIEYFLEYKNVKNINLRIKPDGKVYVSANRLVPKKIIDEFVISKTDFIKRAIERSQDILPQKQYFSEEEIKEVILNKCQKAYLYFKEKGIEYPEIKFRKMVSRWGSCHPEKRILTFNTNLMYAPEECIWYVVLHEFTHFLVANHSDKFYRELELVCPEWKEQRKKMKTIRIK